MKRPTDWPWRLTYHRDQGMFLDYHAEPPVPLTWLVGCYQVLQYMIHIVGKESPFQAMPCWKSPCLGRNHQHHRGSFPSDSRLLHRLQKRSSYSSQIRRPILQLLDGNSAACRHRIPLARCLRLNLKIHHHCRRTAIHYLVQIALPVGLQMRP